MNDKKYDALVIDFETATEQNNSACAIGLTLIKGTEIIKTESHKIQPQKNEYRTSNIKIHAMQPRDTETEPTFDLIWPKISHYFSESEYITAYNDHFDMSVLKCCLELYNLDPIDFEYFDSISFSTKVCGGNNRKLNERCATLQIELEEHHNAMADSIAAAEIIVKCLEAKNIKSVPKYLNRYSSISIKLFSELIPTRVFNNGKYIKTDLNIINNIDNDADAEINELFGKNIVFTAHFTEHKEVLQTMASKKGAIIKDNVSKKIDILVIGKVDLAESPSGFTTNERKARELNQKGKNITILNELEFRSLFPK